jgi:hypothetical protein
LRSEVTANKWISNVTSWALTDWIVVDHLAPSVGTANSRARIDALLADASCGQAALRTDDTLRAAVWWASNEVGVARTDTGTIHFSLLAVRTAWIWIARIFWDYRLDRWRSRPTG